MFTIILVNAVFSNRCPVAFALATHGRKVDVFNKFGTRRGVHHVVATLAIHIVGIPLEFLSCGNEERTFAAAISSRRLSLRPQLRRQPCHHGKGHA